MSSDARDDKGDKNSSSSNANSKQRDTLIEIQTRLEFQDLTITELNDVITDQQKQLDQLNARLELLSDKLSVVEESSDAPEVNEKPPHY
ncbi:MAG: SlyX family protein [Gammaproteobacteria bacterium]|jgi:SlyX protein|nr:SlyX family protein [Gammaproteobacteria bacterium]MBT6043094.1 SlyX family protein [Gammaproteobacteria bacterium]